MTSKELTLLFKIHNHLSLKNPQVIYKFNEYLQAVIVKLIDKGYIEENFIKENLNSYFDDNEKKESNTANNINYTNLVNNNGINENYMDDVDVVNNSTEQIISYFDDPIIKKDEIKKIPTKLCYEDFLIKDFTYDNSSELLNKGIIRLKNLGFV